MDKLAFSFGLFTLVFIVVGLVLSMMKIDILMMAVSCAAFITVSMMELSLLKNIFK